MRVHIIDIDAVSGEETYRTTAELSECFPDAGPIGDDFRDAVHDLAFEGRHRLGGGAAPMVLLLDASRHWVGYDFTRPKYRVAIMRQVHQMTSILVEGATNLDEATKLALCRVKDDGAKWETLSPLPDSERCVGIVQVLP